MFPFNTEKGIVNNLVKEILKIREDVLERLETLEEQVEVKLPLVTEERLQELVGSITPIKGKDYFTDEEKEELRNSIQALIETPQAGKDYFTDDEKARFTGEIRKKLSKEIADAILKIKPKEVVREVAKEVTPDEIALKLNTLEGAIDSKVVKGIPTIEDFLKELKDPKGKNKLSAEHILNMPARGKLDQRWHGAGDTVEAGENITITEVDGKKVISATSGGAVDSVNGQTGVVVLDAQDVGAVASVVAGTGISVDATDPQNPIVSSTVTGTVESVTGLNTDNTDPQNPIVQISVDGSTITGAGTPVSPLVASTPVLIQDTQANILLLTPTNGLTAYATDTKRIFVGNGTNWLVGSGYFATDLGVTDVGFQQSSNRSGYGQEYITDKLIANCYIGSNADPRSGAVKVDLTTNLLYVYLSGLWQPVVSNLTMYEAGGVLRHNPIGYTSHINVYSGNSTEVGLNGIPIVQGYATSLGAYPVLPSVDGGTF